MAKNSQDLWTGCSRDLLIASRFMVALVVGSLDQSAVLEAGRVVELGTPAELLARDGASAALAA
ncbi:MAG TPA: hypothetical protein VEK80_14810 [Kribbellaceae bacterium]|nr:hypothetical protein [Kribbellaceae bacterium]